jgi:hypothetical protein
VASVTGCSSTRKFAVVLRDDLAVWQKTNVTAFLVSGIAATVPAVVGEPYRDASGNEYLPMLVQPVLVTMEPSKPSAIAEQLGHPAVYSSPNMKW